MDVSVHQPRGDQQAGRIENLRSVIALEVGADCRDAPSFYSHVSNAVKFGAWVDNAPTDDQQIV